MIIFISQYKFPEGDAGSERTLYLAQAYKLLGYEVLIVAYGNKAKSGIHKSINYISLRYVRNKYISRLLWYIRLNIVLKDTIKNCSIDAFVAGNLDFISSKLLKLWCLNTKHKLIYDAVEWYDPRQFKKGNRSFIYIENNTLITKTIDKSSSVIAISSYLNNYFKSRNIHTVNIPIIFNQNEYPYIKKTASNTLRLQYAGSPYKKDSLDVILLGLNLLNDEELTRIHFDIIGVDEIQLLNLVGDINVLNRIKPCLSVLGRKSMKYVRNNMKLVDFNILVRNNDFRNVKAGFPTKVIEGISLSTPFIMNFTSDLALYFKDGINCIEVKYFSPEAMKKSLRYALSLSQDDKDRISRSAKETAMENFNIDTYSDRLQDILY